MSIAIGVRPRSWTRKEYERLAERGFFHPDERLELVAGVIYRKARQSPAHTTGIQATDHALRPVFKESFDLRLQFPLALSPDSEPEPDIAVVPGKWEDYIDFHPTSAILIVEVADSSLLHDRKRKARLYAGAGIAEYWILNLVDCCLEVFLNPQDGAYTVHRVLRDGDSVSPLARPEAAIPVASLLPRR